MPIGLQSISKNGPGTERLPQSATGAERQTQVPRKGPTGAVQHANPLEYYEDGYPKLPTCLDRTANKASGFIKGLAI